MEEKERAWGDMMILAWFVKWHNLHGSSLNYLKIEIIELSINLRKSWLKALIKQLISCLVYFVEF